MSIISDLKEARKLELALSQPSLNFLTFSASELLAEIHADLFPDVRYTVRVDFVAGGPLACVAHTSECASIYIHQLLNHSDTPVEVVRLIFKHELLHLRIPPTWVAGKEVQHPPEFWKAERAIAPERNSVWEWVWVNFGKCLRRRPRLQQIDVGPRWKKLWSQPKTDIAICRQMTAFRPEQPEELGGW